MKVLFAVAVLAVALQAVACAPGGLLGLGGIVVAGPTTISRTSLVQTHPSPAVVVASPVVHAVPVHAPVVAAAPIVVSPWAQRTIIAGPAIGVGHGHVW